MLTEKDYCDYETCVALKKLGYNEKTLAYYTSEGIFHWRRAYIYDVAIPDLAKSSNKELYKHVLDAVSLYEAQKWLREEKGFHIEVFFSLMDDKKQLHYDWHIVHNIRFDDDEYTYDCDVFDSMGSYKSYEEALSEGIKEAVKILKRDDTLEIQSD